MNLSFSKLLAFVALALPLGSTSTWARTGQTLVHFDAQPMAVCVDVTTPEFADQHPLDKLVAARLDLSLLVTGTEPQAIDEVIYYVHALEQRAQVIDFSPRTTLVSEIVGTIHVSAEKKHGGGIQLNGGARLESALSADATFSNSAAESDLQTFEKLPSRDAVTTAGTIARGSGVYFKFQRHAQWTLEGEQSLMIVLQVPYDWRADYLRVVCRASGRNRQNSVQLANQSFLIPLYMDGDLAARALATRVLHAQQQLITIVDEEGRAIEKRRLPTLAHELSLADPKIPQNWLESAMWTRAGTPDADYVKYLPKRVHDAIQHYRVARKALLESQAYPAAYAQPSSVASASSTDASSSANVITVLRVATSGDAKELETEANVAATTGEVTSGNHTPSP